MVAQESCPQAACLIAAGLQSRILLPSNGEYTERIDSYWCNSAKVHPACILRPRSALEVAAAVKALAVADQFFAVRAGGHGNAANNNIKGGVTIDLGLLNTTEYDVDAETASIGPAANWKHVYEELEKHGRVVAGARVADVGVGGFLLGGGNTFYTGRHGFACDNVVAYEVVLADGSIITADAGGPHADLFRVLKGGGNNFGIVTRFTMSTLPSGPIWGGFAVRPLSVLPAAAEAIVDFTANSPSDPDSTLNFTMAHMPRLGGGAVVTICTNVAGVEDPAAFAQFRKMPEVTNNLKMTTLQEILVYASLPPNYYNVWYTLCIKNVASIVKKAIELYTQLATEHSAAAGGNMFNLDKYAHDTILIQVNASVRTQELATWAQPRVRAFVADLRAYAETVRSGVCPWLYINYAHPEQEVLQSYGEENLRKMREAAAKYDPKGVFQRLCPGGFKLFTVKDEGI